VWSLFAADDGRDLGWYVNFEAPVERGPSWFATLEHGIDIVIEPDGTWSWKDVDDPEELVREGRVSADVAVEVRRRAEAVAADLDAGRRWWSGWDGWTPGPSDSGPWLPPGDSAAPR
jgi:predicted RNA-binding protein associated with RNAse of E/G family